MMINPIALTVRAKKLGVLIQDARLSAGKTTAQCAQAVGVSEAEFEAYEYGETSPSLPELEALAYYLRVPIDHFWGDRAISGSDGKTRLAKVEQVIGIRQRKIGALLRRARLETRLEAEILADRLNIPAELLEAYELGEEPIPLPTLEALCSELHRSTRDFLDAHGPVGAWVSQQRALDDFKQLPLELQIFVCKPINRPYIELAHRLSEMSADKLRSIAETLLEITF